MRKAGEGLIIHQRLAVNRKPILFLTIQIAWFARVGVAVRKIDYQSVFPNGTAQ